MGSPTGIALLIEEIVALILKGGSIAMDLYLKMEPLLNLGPDEKQNIANAIASSDAADDDTKARVAAWNAAHPVLNEPPTPSGPITPA